MTVRVEYKASAKAMCGRRVVRLERALATNGGKQACAVTLTAEDALSMVGTYRERESGSFFDAWGDGGEMYLDMVPCESYSLVWYKDGERVEDDLWSDWPDAFMAEIESAAKEAMR